MNPCPACGASRGVLADPLRRLASLRFLASAGWPPLVDVDLQPARPRPAAPPPRVAGVHLT